MLPLRIIALLVSEILTSGSYGLMMPILALFLTDKISGANLMSIAVAVAIYLFAQAGFSWIFSSYMHHAKTMERAQAGLFFGSAVITLVPVAYAYSTDMSQVMLAQIVLGLGYGLMYPAWTWLANDHAPNKYLNSLKNLHSLISALSLAAVTAIGGFVAYFYGYNTLLRMMMIFGFLGTLAATTLFFGKTKKRR
ncbi:MAG: hypothetical protein WCT54_02225 [Patescibacteria group bacterium]|jgi:MFS family permease